MAVPTPCFFPASHRSSPDFSFFCGLSFLKETNCLQMTLFTSFLICIKKPMDGRLSSMQKCKALLQYLGKSTEGFYFFLAKNYRAREGGLATCRSAKRFCNPQKIHGGIISFLPTSKKPMDGRLSSMQNRMRFCNTWENPRRDFSRSYAAMEPL